MKKLLSLLGSIGLITISSAQVVACVGEGGSASFPDLSTDDNYELSTYGEINTENLKLFIKDKTGVTVFDKGHEGKYIYALDSFSVNKKNREVYFTLFTYSSAEKLSTKKYITSIVVGDISQYKNKISEVLKSIAEYDIPNNHGLLNGYDLYNFVNQKVYDRRDEIFPSDLVDYFSPNGLNSIGTVDYSSNSLVVIDTNTGYSLDDSDVNFGSSVNLKVGKISYEISNGKDSKEKLIYTAPTTDEEGVYQIDLGKRDIKSVEGITLVEPKNLQTEINRALNSKFDFFKKGNLNDPEKFSLSNLKDGELTLSFQTSEDDKTPKDFTFNPQSENIDTFVNNIFDFVRTNWGVVYSSTINDKIKFAGAKDSYYFKESTKIEIKTNFFIILSDN
jgi:hypothetical protein